MVQTKTQVLTRIIVWSVAIIIPLVVVLGLVYTLAKILTNHKTVLETPAPSFQQKDGSVVIERSATNPKAKSKSELPKGAKLNRQISVTVQPDRTVNQSDVGSRLPTVTTDLSLVDMPDKTRRVIVSSPDGKAIGGLDIPVLPLENPPKWGVGLSYGNNRTAGMWIDRDLGRVRVGVEINQTRNNLVKGYETRVKIGWTF